ncbi:hypothetical protein BOX15_Mlig021525g17 [Macrostomum lignano]|uniref:Uncharacterized protein n=1 Tax=Macrostomum lignano TaxID=282301 RepID=A0A267DCI6_9PLAT|nr:hypothetical protein BOX15_Mlig021525g17 [Macrostomum lignano]
MSPPATALRVTNLVGGVDLRLDGGRGAQLPLRELALSMAHVIYRPVWPRVLIKRMRIPRVTLLLYPTGQLSICGAKTHADAKRAARRFVAMLHRRVPAQLLPHQTICVRIKTITAHGQLPVHSALSLLMLKSIIPNAEYEPESFSALIFNLNFCKCLLFHSGSFVLSRARSLNQLHTDSMRLLNVVLSIE